MAAGPLAGAEVAADDTSAKLQFILVSADSRYRLALGSRWSVHLGATAGGAYVGAQGTSHGTWRGLSPARWVGMVGASGGISWAATPRFECRLDLQALWLLPRPVMLVADERFDLGRPAVSLALGVAITN